jgi:hypothetical protein
MFRVLFRNGAWAMAVALSAGCGGDPLTGFIWDVEVIAATDTCNDPPVDYDGPRRFDYRLDYAGAQVTLALGEESFASGTIAGCEVGYHSVVWPASKDGYDLKWQLTGDATFRVGGDTCNLPNGVDWSGTETFEIVSSDHPQIEVGCTYTLTLEGTYEGPADGDAG